MSCFLCKALILYHKDDKLQLLDHLKSEHTADDGLEYLVAGCLMNSDERQAIVNVVKDREPHYAENDADVSGISLDDSNVETGHDGDSRGDMMIITEEADTGGDSDISISNLVPETTLQEGSGSDLEINRENGECSPPRLDERSAVEFPCPECDRTFNLKIRLNRHLKLHTKKKDAALELNSKVTVTPVSKIIKREGGDYDNRSPKRTPKNYVEPPPGEGHECPACGRRFKNRQGVDKHFEDVHNPGHYPCKGCGKVFTSRNKVSSHYSRNCKQKA